MPRNIASTERQITDLDRHNLYASTRFSGLPNGFPFATSISLDMVFAKWRQLATEQPKNYAAEWDGLQRTLAEHPELTGRLEPTALVEHEEFLQRALRPLFPSHDWQPDTRTITGPFGGYFLLSTPAYDRVFGHHEGGESFGTINVTDPYMRALYAYRVVLSKYYNVSFKIDQPLVFVVPDEATGVSRYYKLNALTNFVSVRTTGELPQLTQADFDDMFQSVGDMTIWTRKLPPELFEFVGITVVRMTHVTDETATASITHTVLTSDASITDENFGRIQDELRNLFGLADLRLGLASKQSNGALNFRSQSPVWNSLVIRDAVRNDSFDWNGTLYERALSNEAPIFVRDVIDADIDNGARSALLSAGVRCLYLQPLWYDAQIVGLLELSSRQARVFDAGATLKMERIKTVFALALFQNLERFETRIESVVQNSYTAIHSSVAWRFREAAITMLQHQRDSGELEPEPVSFHELYPLYGSADIRGSTQHRNEATRADILRRLLIASETVAAMYAVLPLTILDELAHRISGRLKQYESEWNAGDGADAASFLSSEVDSLLASVSEGNADLTSILISHQQQDPDGSSTNAPLSDFYESSEAKINGLIIDMLRREQDEVQKLFPHYFEYAKTDGVEHTMFIGQSIAPNKPFDHAFVHNLRLRQLVLACDIARQVRDLRNKLVVPLDIAQLILVQDTPVSLHFRSDEKRFYLEGSAGVRFEMLKKRLDKAVIRGTNERITQPEHVAIVYSIEREETEYVRYVEYLSAKGFVDVKPEIFDVGDLPGASGLHGMRIRVT